MRKISLSMLFAFFFCCVSVNAANLLANPHFDFRTTNWSAVFSPFAQTDWSDLDALGSPTSGSLMITNTTPIPNSNVLVRQCVPITAGMSYEMGGKVRTVPFQSTTGRTGLLVYFYASTDCTTGLLEATAQYPNSFDPTQRFVSFRGTIPAPAGAASAEVRCYLKKIEGDGTFKAQFDDIFFGPTGSCVPDPSTLCLNERFAVTAKYTTGETGDAHAEQLTTDSGYLWFFNPSNVEAIVKVLNGCGLNGRYWVFAGGLTDVNVELTVTDKKTGLQKIYRNDAGHPFAPIQDTNAFATCD